ncbi:glycosyltransferase family 4 protein [Shewanella sp. FJAT-52076]|uniref:glycosyltransferase family 4 protein n=1 Tax=Shewanella sp. FJAT-52076 TaxID=2864202 RepID=UPI001C65B9C3|nr:glycosyltransferase family 4 protein [Shewanella sp. FJAT-52076]QYJ74043.1 glycosyltransferase family 4 protein [Shewanella sp. FJAT-52076]
MQQLVIVATHTTETRGGISTALAGFERALTDAGVSWRRINSHSDKRGKIRTWLCALNQACVVGRRMGGDGIFWLHCGPWLSMIRKLSIGLVAKAFGCRLIVQFHSPAVAEYLSHPIKKYLVKSLVSLADVTFVLTPWWQKLMLSHFPSAHVRVCSNPLPPDLAEAAARFLAESHLHRERSKTLLTMSRLIEGKGTEQVIASMVLLPEDVNLLIAGEGPCKEKLQAQVHRLGLQERVSFVGWVDTDKKHALLSQVRAFCLPSRYDSFGMVFIEAMAFGLPVVACDWGPIADVVPTEGGVLVPDGNVEATANAIQRLIDDFPAINTALGTVTLARYQASQCILPVMDCLQQWCTAQSADK